jgi:hypothetical protein
MPEIRIGETDTAAFIIHRTELKDEQYPAAQIVFYNLQNVVTCVLDLAHPEDAPHQADVSASLDSLKQLADLPENIPLKIQEFPVPPQAPVNPVYTREILLEQLSQAAQTAKTHKIPIATLAGIFDAAKAEVGLTPVDPESAHAIVLREQVEVVVNPFGFSGTLGIAYQTCDDLRTYIKQHSTKIIEGMCELLGFGPADDAPDLPDGDSG